MEKPISLIHTLNEQFSSVGSKYCTIICKKENMYDEYKLINTFFYKD